MAPLATDGADTVLGAGASRVTGEWARFDRWGGYAYYSAIGRLM
jgi:hypothetical protein